MSKALKIEDGDFVAAARIFLAEMLTTGVCASILAPQRVKSGAVAFPALVSDPEKMMIDPFAPVLAVATAKMVSKLTCAGTPSEPIAVVLPNCQIRALVELEKLKQANLDNIIVIGIDCPGTFSIMDYAEIAGDTDSNTLYAELVAGTSKKQSKLRSSCVTCREPIPEICDIVIGSYGADLKKELLITAKSPRGEAILGESNVLVEAQSGSDRDAVVQELKNARALLVDEFNEQQAATSGIEKVVQFYERCIGCHNCRGVCPICYCSECFFDSANLDRSADNLISKARAKGTFKVPMDTLLFHTGRMNHMILSCVECGLCEQACPTNIPLMQNLKRVAHDAQTKFGYVPGRSKDEEMPLVVFKEDEYHTEGGE